MRIDIKDLLQVRLCDGVSERKPLFARIPLRERGRTTQILLLLVVCISNQIEIR